jgi:hypothetical protein
VHDLVKWRFVCNIWSFYFVKDRDTILNRETYHSIRLPLLPTFLYQLRHLLVMMFHILTRLCKKIFAWKGAPNSFISLRAQVHDTSHVLTISLTELRRKQTRAISLNSVSSRPIHHGTQSNLDEMVHISFPQYLLYNCIRRWLTNITILRSLRVGMEDWQCITHKICSDRRQIK